MSKETFVKGDSCPKKLSPNEKLAQINFSTPRTKVSVDKCSLGKKSPWTNVPWTKVSMDNCPLDKCFYTGMKNEGYRIRSSG